MTATTAKFDRNPDLDALCPPHRRHDDTLYAQWVVNVITTLPTSRASYHLIADQNMWEAWRAEGHQASAWLEGRVTR